MPTSERVVRDEREPASHKESELAATDLIRRWTPRASGGGHEQGATSKRQWREHVPAAACTNQPLRAGDGGGRHERELAVLRTGRRWQHKPAGTSW